MQLSRPTTRLWLALLACAGLVCVLVAPPATAGQTGPGPATCTTPPMRAPAARLAADPGAEVDPCHAVFFVEGPQPAPLADADGPAAVATGLAPLSSTFDLSSSPGSDHTLYLKFTGQTIRDTAWNTDYHQDTVNVAPFSLTPPVDTHFSRQELIEIQRAWAVTAEDFAPFDVNVTTKQPPADALTRTDVSDPTYGSTIVVTQGGPISAVCRCGGLAYGGVFAAVGDAHETYQPALVFGGFNGDGIGEAISHEAGHTFGLWHDGTQTSPYYDGRAPWAPIMGSSYDEPITQWSAGEYPGANNQQDDLAVIAASAPLRTDDHGDTASAATPLTLGHPVAGLISTRVDVDAFSFVAGGTVTVSAVPTAAKSDLDIGLRIVDASGTTVATVDPPVRRQSPASAAGLGATWTARLPVAPASYTVLVDGVGSGSPRTPGRYSDYASLGGYRIAVTGR
ncbi:MAG: hypothetical protein ACXVW4_06685 [Nocardioides sp.]